MNLLDIVNRLDELDEDASIFVARVDCAIIAESPAAVVLLTSEESDRSLDQVVAEKCPGMEYVVDVDIARGIVARALQLDVSESSRALKGAAALIAYVEQ